MSKEKDFHRELITDMAAQGVIIKKVPDVPVSRVQQHMTAQGLKEFRFSPPKFVDLVGVGYEATDPATSTTSAPPWGRPLIWEAKMMKKLGAWPLKSLREEQLRILFDFEQRAHSRVLINYRVKDFTDVQIKKYNLEHCVDHKRINVLVAVTPSQVLEAIRSGAKSIPVATLSTGFVQRPWGGVWYYADILNSSIAI